MKKIAISLILLGVASAAIARPVYRTQGFYTGVTGGVSYAYDNQGVNEAGHKFEYFGLGALVSAGYQLNSFFAAEADFTYFKPKNSLGTAKAYQPALVFKGIMPLIDNFSIYGKAGVADTMYRYDASDERDSVNRVKPLVGLGFAYAVSQKLDVTVLAQTTVNYTKHDGRKT